LDGFLYGWYKLLVPDWSKLAYWKTWKEAFIMGIFSWSSGCTLPMVFASLRKVDSKTVQASYLLVVLNSGTAVFASFIIFGYLGYYATLNGITFEELPIQGPELTFVTMPMIVASLPWPNLWLATFCLIIVMLGIDSTFGGVESVCYMVKD
jgi:SNF family Na+-dependent transporter